MKGTEKLRSEFLKSFAFGVLYVIAVPVLIILLFITVIGIPLGLLSLSFYIFTLAFAPTIAAVIITYWVNQKYNRNWNRWITVLISGGVFLVLWMVIMIPFIGWLIGIVIIGAAIGSLLLSSFHREKKLVT